MTNLIVHKGMLKEYEPVFRARSCYSRIMQLVINGQQKDFPELAGDAKISDLIMQLGLKIDRVAIEQNGEIVPRSTWESAALRSGDKLEIVHFVGGGLS